MDSSLTDDDSKKTLADALAQMGHADPSQAVNPFQPAQAQPTIASPNATADNWLMSHPMGRAPIVSPQELQPQLPPSMSDYGPSMAVAQTPPPSIAAPPSGPVQTVEHKEPPAPVTPKITFTGGAVGGGGAGAAQKTVPYAGVDEAYRERELAEQRGAEDQQALQQSKAGQLGQDAAARDAATAQENTAYGAQTDADKKASADFQAAQAKHADIFQAADAARQARRDAIFNQKVDPSQYWKKMGAFHGVMLGLASILGGFNEGFSSGQIKNPATEQIRQGIEDEINAQHANIDNQARGAQAEQEAAEKGEQTHERAADRTEMAAERARTEVDRVHVAKLAAVNDTYEKAKEMTELLAQQSGDPTIVDNANKTIAELNLENNKTAAQYGVKLSTGKHPGTLSGAPTGSSGVDIGLGVGQAPSSGAAPTVGVDSTGGGFDLSGLDPETRAAVQAKIDETQGLQHPAGKAVLAKALGQHSPAPTMGGGQAPSKGATQAVADKTGQPPAPEVRTRPLNWASPKNPNEENVLVDKGTIQTMDRPDGVEERLIARDPEKAEQTRAQLLHTARVDNIGGQLTRLLGQGDLANPTSANFHRFQDLLLTLKQESQKEEPASGGGSGGGGGIGLIRKLESVVDPNGNFDTEHPVKSFFKRWAGVDFKGMQQGIKTVMDEGDTARRSILNNTIHAYRNPNTGRWEEEINQGTVAPEPKGAARPGSFQGL